MDNMSNFVESIELETSVVSLRRDGIIENRFVRDVQYEVTPETIDDIREASLKLSGGDHIYLLTIPGLYGSISGEVKNSMPYDQMEKTIAIAIIIKSLSQRILANLFFSLKKAPVPVYFFKEESQAVVWLLSRKS